jgi:predicted nucleic-acid-binding protein
MAALDTSVLVRYLVEDDVAQLATARRLIRRCVASGEALFVPISVALELEWVLRSNFRFSREAVIEVLSSLLAAGELTFESEGAVELALALYAQTEADYSDCLHVALADQAGRPPLWTFDKAAAKVTGVRLLV